MTDSITPPPELLQLWFEQHYAYNKELNEILIEVAKWGADQELEACCKWLVKQGWFSTDEHEAIEELRAARRLKPPSLKEQALLAIDTAVADDRLSADVASVVRRALEACPMKLL
jgi:hypothetical protein